MRVLGAKVRGQASNGHAWRCNRGNAILTCIASPCFQKVLCGQPTQLDEVIFLLLPFLAIAFTTAFVEIASAQQLVSNVNGGGGATSAFGPRPSWFLLPTRGREGVDYGMARPSEDIEYDDPSLKEEELIHDDFNFGHRYRQKQLQRCWCRRPRCGECPANDAAADVVFHLIGFFLNFCG